MFARCHLASIALAVISAACTVEVALEGKPCPCISGYRCENDVCVADDGTGARGDCLVGAASFRATWSTPGSIRWDWDPVGREEDFGAYEIVTGEDANDLEPGSPSTRTWTREDNPELGVYTLRRTGQEELVSHTITDGLSPGTPYYAKLRVADSGGCVYVPPNVAGKQTTDAKPQIPILVDADQPGWTQELEYVAAAGGACFDGSSGCWRGEFTCSSGQDSCFYNFQKGDMHLAIGGVITEGNFSTAYLSLRLDNQVSAQSWWGLLMMTFADIEAPFGREPLVFRTGGGYRLLEIPLTALSKRKDLEEAEVDAVLLTPADIGGYVEGFSVGLEGSPGEVVWVDDVRIGW